VIGAAALALYAVATGVSLKVPADQWPRLTISAILNVALWVAVMSYALLWLPASEAVVIAYTMPVWTALLAWPLLGGPHHKEPAPLAGDKVLLQRARIVVAPVDQRE
jgi:drug/metabolite transporter (DMT)-like permease